MWFDGARPVFLFGARLGGYRNPKVQFSSGKRNEQVGHSPAHVWGLLAITMNPKTDTKTDPQDRPNTKGRSRVVQAGNAATHTAALRSCYYMYTYSHHLAVGPGRAGCSLIAHA